MARMTSRLVVLDASVGVKWFMPESGHHEAVALLRAVADGDVTLVVPDLFVYEVLRAVRRKADDESVREALEFFESAGLVTVPPVSHVMQETLEQAASLVCDLYDACAPALASILGAEFYSADRRAHASFPGVHLIG